MTEWLDAIINLPADALKAIGTIAVGGTLAGATYVVSRIKEARRPADTVPGLPRFAFDPVDRDMGFTLIRTGTDLTPGAPRPRRDPAPFVPARRRRRKPAARPGSHSSPHPHEVLTLSATNATTSITRILAHEAGYVNNPKDPGGPTNRGITQATLSAWRGHPVTKADVRALPEAEAVAIYKAEYWARVHGDDLPGGLDYAVVDVGVNSGVGRANKYLQTVLKGRKLYAGDIDGVIGTKTLAAIAALTPAVVAAVIRDLCTMRLQYLKKLEGWPSFGNGWGRRVAEVQAASLALAAGTYDHAEADLPDPAPTVRGAPVQVAASRTGAGKATALAAVGVIGDQASTYAGTFQSLSDIAPVFRYVFAALTVIGVLAGLYKAVQLAKGSEASAPTPTAPKAGNDNAAGISDTVPGSAFELPPGTVIPSAISDDARIVAIHEQALPDADPVLVAGDEGPVPATVGQAA